MLINTAILGEMEASDDNIFDIPEGLLGFDNINKYALITKQDEDVTLRWLQSVNSIVPCFVVFDPFEIINGYEPVLEKHDIKALRAKEDTKLDFLVIAVVPDEIEKITVNLKSPVVINRSEGIARQVILQNEYPIKFPLSGQEQDSESKVELEGVSATASAAVR